MTKSGAIPYSPSRRVSAMSAASTAGWVISVRRRSASACATASGRRGRRRSAPTARGRRAAAPSTRRRSSNVSATIGSRSPQLAEHVRVLRALPGVHERHLAGGAGAAEDAAGRERVPSGRRVARRAPAAPARPSARARRRRRSRSRSARPRAGPPPRERDAEARLTAAGGVGHCAQPCGQLAAVARRRARARRATAPSWPRPRPTGASLARAADTAIECAVALQVGRARAPRARRGSSCHRIRTRSRPRRGSRSAGDFPVAQLGVDARTVSWPSRCWGWAARS